MGWAKDNPEAYDEVLRNGVYDKLIDSIRDNGYPADSLSQDYVQNILENVIHSIQSCCPKGFDELVSWAKADVADAEADFLMGGR